MGVSVGTSHGTSYRQEHALSSLYWMNCPKAEQHWSLTVSDLQLAKQLDLQEDIG